MNSQQAIKNIRQQLKQYIEENKLHSLVLGVSGGIDSALIAALASPVCQELNIPLIGRSLPADSNRMAEIERAIKIGESFCDNFETIHIDRFADELREKLVGEGTTKEDRVRKGNIMARTRMIILYDLAQKNRGLVLSTDNYTEYLLGYWTLCGDVGDFAPIQNLWKTEVYELSRWLVHKDSSLSQDQRESLEACHMAIPTDGLGITDSDLDQIGAESYEEADRLLKEYLDILEGFIPANAVKDFDREVILNILREHPVIQRHIRTEFKREWPISISRSKII